MVADGRAKVLEFNVRFGDPECQVLMLRLRSDLMDLVLAVLDGTLAGHEPVWEAQASAGVVLAARGYPGEPAKGDAIAGLDEWDGGVVFHSGTVARDGAVVTSGGRVLTVAALGTDVAAAVERAYVGVQRITFAGMQYRRDIGRRAGAVPAAGVR
jgi:phosphoribosylamine--glycine ligase